MFVVSFQGVDDDILSYCNYTIGLNRYQLLKFSVLMRSLIYKNGQKTPWHLSLGMNGRPEQSQ